MIKTLKISEIIILINIFFDFEIQDQLKIITL